MSALGSAVAVSPSHAGAGEEFWLNALFWQARRAPIVGKILKPLAIEAAWRSPRLHQRIVHNARGIFGPDVTDAQIGDYARGVISSCFDFVCDVARASKMTAAQIAAQIECIDGQDDYLHARAARKGAIIATAHMGSFEPAAAALTEREKRVHVVFKRDRHRLFEHVRSDLRRRLAVIEAPIDDGPAVWFRLRDALLRDEVVMLQADRAMPGQKGAIVPFLHGRLELPTGPIKLALASGAPIIPIIAVRSADGRIKISIEPAITVGISDDLISPALLQLARVLEKYVRANPQQWLVLHRAFCEDAKDV